MDRSAFEVELIAVIQCHIEKFELRIEGKYEKNGLSVVAVLLLCVRGFALAAGEYNDLAKGAINSTTNVLTGLPRATTAG